MSEDPILARFAELERPGRRPLLSEMRQAQTNDGDESEDGERRWDSKPIKLTRKGVLTDFFTVGDLALALGRRPVTIRSWEDKGWLPRTQLQTRPPERTEALGRKPVGRRLYTRHMVEVVVRAAKVSGVMNYNTVKKNQALPDWPRFTNLVLDGWKHGV